MAAQFCKSGNRIIIQNISIPPCRINRAFPLIPQTETCIYTDHKENRRVHSIRCLSNNPTVISPRVPQKAPNISLPPGATLNFCGLGCHSQRSDDCEGDDPKPFCREAAHDHKNWKSNNSPLLWLRVNTGGRVEDLLLFRRQICPLWVKWWPTCNKITQNKQTDFRPFVPSWNVITVHFIYCFNFLTFAPCETQINVLFKALNPV